MTEIRHYIYATYHFILVCNSQVLNAYLHMLLIAQWSAESGKRVIKQLTDITNPVTQFNKYLSIEDRC